MKYTAINASGFGRRIGETGATVVEVALFSLIAFVATFATIELGRYYYAKAQVCEFAERASDEMQKYVERAYGDTHYTQDEFFADVDTLNTWGHSSIDSHPSFHFAGGGGTTGEVVMAINSYDEPTENVVAVLRNSSDTARDAESVGPSRQHPESAGGTRYSPITPFYVEFKVKHDQLLYNLVPGINAISCGAYVADLPWADSALEGYGGECLDDLFGISLQAQCEAMNTAARACYWEEETVTWEGETCSCYCYALDDGGGSYRGPVGEIPTDSCDPPLACGRCETPNYTTCTCDPTCDPEPTCGDGFCLNCSTCECDGPVHTPMRACAGETFAWNGESCAWSSLGHSCPAGQTAVPYPVCCAASGGGGGGGPTSGGGGGGGPTTGGGSGGGGSSCIHTEASCNARGTPCHAYAAPNCGCHGSGCGTLINITLTGPTATLACTTAGGSAVKEDGGSFVVPDGVDCMIESGVPPETCAPAGMMPNPETGEPQQVYTCS